MTTKFYDRLSNDLAQLLEDPIDYNVSIEVSEEPDNKNFKGHSCILQSRSSYFKKKINEIPFNENHIKVINMPNISVKIFDVIIKYIYRGTISLEKLENSIIFDLLISANELDLDELVEHIQTHLVNNNASWLRLNFTQVYQTSYQTKNFTIIQEFCNDIIAKYPNIIFESENFLSLPEYALITILKRDDLQLEEGKIWDYAIQWGKAQNQTLPTNLDEWINENFLTLKTTLKQILPQIRYFNISGNDVLDKLFPYLQLFETKLWLDISSRFMAPDRPITSTILPPRKILNDTLPTRTITDEDIEVTDEIWTENIENMKNIENMEDVKIEYMEDVNIEYVGENMKDSKCEITENAKNIANSENIENIANAENIENIEISKIDGNTENIEISNNIDEMRPRRKGQKLKMRRDLDGKDGNKDEVDENGFDGDGCDANECRKCTSDIYREETPYTENIHMN
ncbi:hypothetical protein Glove_349g101 [Diversispora epigaea]|uniref:BTB domain-containing protein n=1 Tax=Diversispora epigaea TaxID=1348612 RepID=A0A397HIK9_9GLOM|nr:hypothetical protein Glove_349g101 [Diversispora epigaea]